LRNRCRKVVLRPLAIPSPYTALPHLAAMEGCPSTLRIADAVDTVKRVTMGALTPSPLPGKHGTFGSRRHGRGGEHYSGWRRLIVSFPILSVLLNL
jgi:hypothetical protein